MSCRFSIVTGGVGLPLFQHCMALIHNVCITNTIVSDIVLDLSVYIETTMAFLTVTVVY